MIVAVVIPAREAEGMLRGCIESVRAQQRPADEVWIVVGPSRDGTLKAARELADDITVVLENPAGDRGSAINQVLDASRADAFAFVDTQSRLDPDYLSSALDVLDRTGAAVVGGPMRASGPTPVAKAMAAALGSPFGIGDSQFHFVGTGREVESVYLGVYRASAFHRVGHYNAALLRTEDDDINARIRAAGLRIWLDPAIGATYLCRTRLADIWTQYRGYGYWKVGLGTIRRSAIRPRHFVPAAFVGATAVGAAISAVAWRPALAVLSLAYVGVAWTDAARMRGLEIRARLIYPLVTLTMHVGYGVGSLIGLFRWAHLRAAASRGAATAEPESLPAFRGNRA